MALSPWLQKLENMMEENGLHAQFFTCPEDQDMLWSQEDGEWCYFEGMTQHAVNWHLLKALYVNAEKEKENLQGEGPIPATLEFIKLYIMAGRIDRQLLKFEDLSMTQFLKEIFVVYTGQILSREERIDYATRMLKKAYLRTRYVLDFMGDFVEKQDLVHREMKMSAECFEAFHAQPAADFSAREYDVVVDKQWPKKRPRKKKSAAQREKQKQKQKRNKNWPDWNWNQRQKKWQKRDKKWDDEEEGWLCC